MLGRDCVGELTDYRWVVEGNSHPRWGSSDALNVAVPAERRNFDVVQVELIAGFENEPPIDSVEPSIDVISMSNGSWNLRFVVLMLHIKSSCCSSDNWNLFKGVSGGGCENYIPDNGTRNENGGAFESDGTVSVGTGRLAKSWAVLQSTKSLKEGTVMQWLARAEFKSIKM